MGCRIAISTTKYLHVILWRAYLVVCPIGRESGASPLKIGAEPSQVKNKIEVKT